MSVVGSLRGRLKGGPASPTSGHPRTVSLQTAAAEGYSNAQSPQHAEQRLAHNAGAAAEKRNGVTLKGPGAGG